MKKFSIIISLMLVSLVLVFVTYAFLNVILPVHAQDEQQYDVIFSIPVGESGIHYEGVGIPEALTWGPSALAIANDGSFWIADTAGNRLLRFSPKGEFLGKIDLDGLVVGAADLVVSSDIVTILDQSSLPPKVVRLTDKGNVLGTYDLPPGLYLEDGLSGISQGDQGELLIEREFGGYVTQFLDEKGNFLKKVETSGLIHNGKLYSAHPSGLDSINPRHGDIFIGDKKIGIDTVNDLGGMQILGFGLKEDFYILIEELILNPAIQVDQTIRHYDGDGNLLGTARMPLDEQYTYVANDFAIGTDGSLYAMATRPDRIDIIRLSFFQKISPILKQNPERADSNTLYKEESSILALVSRDTMISTAASYRNNSKYFNSTNTDGTCAGRGKPRYISGAGTYPSVSYDWGGFDTVSGFNGYMDPNTKQAGDIDTSTEEPCSKGVDCSGFVSRTWLLTSRKGTCDLEGISTELSSTSELQKGDILNKCKDHVVLFKSFNGTSGVYDYESTKYNSYDRVVFIASSWSRFSGYSPREYNNVRP